MSELEATHCPGCGEELLTDQPPFKMCPEHGPMIVTTTLMPEVEHDVC